MPNGNSQCCWNCIQREYFIWGRTEMVMVHNATGTYHTFNCERAVSFMHGKDSMAGFFNVFQPIENYMSSISIKLTCWFIVIDLYALEQRTFHLIFKLMLIFSLQRMSSFYVLRSPLKRTTIDKWLCGPTKMEFQSLFLPPLKRLVLVSQIFFS